MFFACNMLHTCAQFIQLVFYFVIFTNIQNGAIQLYVLLFTGTNFCHMSVFKKWNVSLCWDFKTGVFQRENGKKGFFYTKPPQDFSLIMCIFQFFSNCFAFLFFLYLPFGGTPLLLQQLNIHLEVQSLSVCKHFLSDAIGEISQAYGMV